MSSQASSAGHGEKEVRQQNRRDRRRGRDDLHPLELLLHPHRPMRAMVLRQWQAAERRDQVLMLDARNIYRKVTRKIYDFSPEQLANLTAIVWLYRGQRDRFLGLVQQYLGSVCTESAAIPEELNAFEATLTSLRERFDICAKALKKLDQLDIEKTKAVTEAVAELRDAVKPYETDRACLLHDLEGFRKDFSKTLPETNDLQHAARQAFEPMAERSKGLIKQVDLLYKLAARVADLAGELASDEAVQSMTAGLQANW